MKNVVNKWGDSLAICIPLEIAKELQMTEGSEVEIEIVEGHLTVTPKPEKYSELDELIDAISPENLHQEIECDSEIGNEVW
ncbi:MazF family transcriptional regulator [Leptolyngbya valderiana BDU 20041]|nr:AbrB/MazE/SpoVT family DNA-binding domain-containing protein [Geitlerinema sp. CS-897]OAB63660.1 MazF family transcriptional regulator [Leptolyngbya valderiana BDU 20041]